MPNLLVIYWNLGLALLLTDDEMAAQLCWASGLSQAEAGSPEFDEAELLLFLHQVADQYQSMQRPDLAARIRRFLDQS